MRLAAVDADDNAMGGVRLPHMPAEDGTSAGAPLGRYTGFALDRKEENVYFTISGVFEPFPPEKLAELYPDHNAYVEKVAAAASALAEARYILPRGCRRVRRRRQAGQCRELTGGQGDSTSSEEPG